MDPEVAELLAQFPTADIDLSQFPVEVVRQGLDGMSGDARRDPVDLVQNLFAPGPAGDIPVRLYRPDSSTPLPVLVFFHGGGFVSGSPDTHDGLCRKLANLVPCAVVSVDYRLAPEHKFPAAPEDCFAATRFVAEKGYALGVDAKRIAVAGDSAGGNLAAVTAQICRDRNGPELRHQLLIYPITDVGCDTPSYAENASGYLLTRDLMRWFWNHYLDTPADGTQILASPLRAEDLSGLAPATVITAEFDPLRDEGEAYARRLRAAGVDAQLERYDGQIHGFLLWEDRIARAGAALRAISGRLSEAFAAPNA